jgi:hypothetical protein
MPVGKDGPQSLKPLDYAPSTRITDIVFWILMTCFTSDDLRKLRTSSGYGLRSTTGRFISIQFDDVGDVEEEVGKAGRRTSDLAGCRDYHRSRSEQ